MLARRCCPFIMTFPGLFGRHPRSQGNRRSIVPLDVNGDENTLRDSLPIDFNGVHVTEWRHLKRRAAVTRSWPNFRIVSTAVVNAAVTALSAVNFSKAAVVRRLAVS